MGALTRDPHRSSDMRDRHLLLTNPLHEQQPAVERQAGVTVTHEDLLDCGDGNPHSTRRSSLTSTRHQRPGRVQLEGVEDRPGYLGEMARRLADNGVNIDVAYL